MASVENVKLELGVNKETKGGNARVRCTLVFTEAEVNLNLSFALRIALIEVDGAPDLYHFEANGAFPGGKYTPDPIDGRDDVVAWITAKLVKPDGASKIDIVEPADSASAFPFNAAEAGDSDLKFRAIVWLIPEISEARVYSDVINIP